MTRARRYLAIGLVLCGLAGLALSDLYRHSASDLHDDPEVENFDTGSLIGRPRPDFTLPDLKGVVREPSSWDGRVIVMNFWATWCEPCRREIPALVDLQGRYGAKGVQVVGIAIDDRKAVERFFGDVGISVSYPVLAGGEVAGIEVAKSYGNAFGVLPYTVIVDRAGKIVFVQLGELTLAQAERAVTKLL
jgi:thiol-disulfide isomerase/thioredoxin